MDKKLIRESIFEVAGKPAEVLVDFLDGKKYMNEFLIAKKLDLPINQTRNILYKISEFGLVSSTRKKDKKKGWYTYSWKLEELKSLEFLRNFLLRKMEQIRNQIKSRETREFYVCEKCHVEFNEENALVHDFTCPECGSLLIRKDNTKLLKEFKKNLDEFEKDLKIVNEEIGREQVIENKKLVAKDAATRRARLKLMAEKRAQKKEAAKKEANKMGKSKKESKKLVSKKKTKK